MIPEHIRWGDYGTPQCSDHEREMIKDGIKALREKLGMTQEEFGRQVGVKRLSVINWETGKRIPFNSMLEKLHRLEQLNAEAKDGQSVPEDQHQ